MLYSIKKIMKYLVIYLITNILVISIIFTSADDSSNPDVKKEYSKAIITFKDGEKSPGDLHDVAPLSADITFTDADGNNIAVVETGSFIKFDIEIKADGKYKDGKVMKCEIYETANTSNRKQLYDICTKNESIEDWVWDEGNQKLETNFKVTKLPGSESDEFTIECSAIVCKKYCPELSCLKTDSKQKRKRAAFGSFLMSKILNLLLVDGFRRIAQVA